MLGKGERERRGEESVVNVLQPVDRTMKKSCQQLERASQKKLSSLFSSFRDCTLLSLSLSLFLLLEHFFPFERVKGERECRREGERERKKERGKSR